MARAKARKYTDSQKSRILELAEQEGIMAASKRYKISTSVIYNWRSKAKGGKKPKKTVARTAQGAPTTALKELSKEELMDMVVRLTLENYRLQGFNVQG